MKAIIVAILALAGLTVMAERAGAAPSGGARRRVVGKSKHVWFTGAGTPSSSGEAAINVFNSATGNDLVLSYEQLATDDPHHQIHRVVTFEAPTSLAAIAKSDFI